MEFFEKKRRTDGMSSFQTIPWNPPSTERASDPSRLSVAGTAVRAAGRQTTCGEPGWNTMTALSRGLRTAPPFPSARSYMPPTSKPCTPPQKEAPAGRVGEGRTPGRRWTACLWADVGMATASVASAAPVAERPDSFQAPGSTRFSAREVAPAACPGARPSGSACLLDSAGAW